MNTKIKTTALVCAALFAVTACSSGGESGPDINPTNPITPTKPTTPAQPTTPSQPTPSEAVGGNAMTSTNASYNTAKYVTPQGKMNASVTIDGRKIDLSKANAAFIFYRETAPTEDKMSTRQTVLSGRKYSHVQFGAQTVGIISPTYQPTLHHDSFAIGNITPTSGADAMPTSGKASYVGDAILLQAAAYTTSTSKFNVDFGRKTISGLIGYVNDIPVSGKISGSSFSGEQDGIRMKGNFFGPKAAELGGVFSAEHDGGVYQGSFGAKKQ